jgi:hypothetical protein
MGNSDASKKSDTSKSQISRQEALTGLDIDHPKKINDKNFIGESLFLSWLRINKSRDDTCLPITSLHAHNDDLLFFRTTGVLCGVERKKESQEKDK